jgi:hypothetical protein
MQHALHRYLSPSPREYDNVAVEVSQQACLEHRLRRPVLYPRVCRVGSITELTQRAVSQNHTKPVARSWTAIRIPPAVQSQSAVGSAWVQCTPTPAPINKSAVE